MKPYLLEGRIEAGCDEAGRGCLAGPVVAAAVVLPPNFKNEELNDSKQLTEKQRKRLRQVIEKEALAWAVAAVSPQEIDQINILWASVKAMHKAIAKLKVVPEFLLIDGNKFKPFQNIPYQTVVKGDATYQSIAAASVLAKTHRDELMERASKWYPIYRWDVNKGYPTKAHREAIELSGVTPLHRMSFRLTDTQLSFDFDDEK
ncbi:MAG: ribonuclease HII [Bacteroidales bacterium]|nr:ribonuclease HII [Bacteroidales bacterium]